MSGDKSKPLASEYADFLTRELERLSGCTIPRSFHSRDSKRDTLRFCLSEIPLKSGFIAEFGVHKGDSIRLIAGSLPQLQIHGFDSFVGFPNDGRSDWQSDFSLSGVLPEVPSNVTLHKGFFSDSIPPFLRDRRTQSKAAFIHIDCDIYSSTVDVLSICSNHIQSGTVIVFDELVHYNGCLQNELLAFYEFITSRNLKFEWLGIRGRVLPFSAYLSPPAELTPLPKVMRDWRILGYEQEVAVRIL